MPLAPVIDPGLPVVSRRRIDISAPVEQVWAVHVAVAAWPSWQPDIADLESDAPELHAGGWFTWSSGGLRIRSEVLVVDADARETWWGGPAQGIEAVHHWLLTPMGQSTRVLTEETWDGDAVRQDIPAAQRALDGSLDRWLELLRRRTES